MSAHKHRLNSATGPIMGKCAAWGWFISSQYEQGPESKLDNEQEEAHVHGSNCVVTGSVPFVLGKLEQLLQALIQVTIAPAHIRKLLELPHLGHPEHSHCRKIALDVC